MPWPMSQDYNEAIQDPVQSFSDPELKRGEAVCNALGLPVPCSGNFADVYAVQCGQRKWAVKCFTRQIPGLQERYVQISKYLKEVPLPFMVDFQFMEQGIRVRGQWYPILKMQWVEGFQLNTLVRDNLDKPPVLQTLCQIWLRLAQKLREANLAHCDLQHGNVMLVPGSKAGAVGVKLVDYDGMCVPSLEFLKTIEVGHAAYQHPQRLREGTYGLQTDRFAHLVIYTALRGLAVGGRTLWDKFDNGDNLLFKQPDFEKPAASGVFAALAQSKDAEVRKLAAAVAAAAGKPIEQVPLLEDLVEVPRPTTKVQAAVPSKPAALPSAPQAAPESVFGAAMSGETPRRKPVKKPASKVGYYAAAAAAALLLLVGGGIALTLLGGPSNKTTPAVADAGHATQPTPAARPSRAEVARPTIPVLPTTRPEVKKDPEPEPKKDPDPEPKKDPDPTPADTIVADLGDGIKLKLVPIQPGEFLMGAPKNEAEHLRNEVPQHKVRITRPFYMGAYLVTQGQYEKIMGKNFSAHKGDPDYPVEQLSWNEAVEFCKRLSERPAEKAAGRVYRLPTEAEWEYTCRAGTTTAFSCGDSLSSTQANFDGNQPYGGADKGPTIGRSVKVGQYKPNAWGLYDMHGNVKQWCQDGGRVYTQDAVTDPVGDPATGRYAVRGSSFADPGWTCRSAFRQTGLATQMATNCGFRVALSVTDPLAVAPKPDPEPAPANPATKALHFTGQDHVELANTKGLVDLDGEFTIEMWVRMRPANQVLVGNDSIENSGTAAAKTKGWSLRTEAATGEERQFTFAMAGPGRTWMTCTGPPRRLTKEWVHIAVCKTPERIAIIFDGNRYHDNLCGGAKFTNSDDVISLGVRPNGRPDSSIDSDIRAFRISNKALYTKPFTPDQEFTKTENTLLLLDFSAGKGKTLPDLSGNKRNGTIVGAKWLDLAESKESTDPLTLDLGGGVKLALVRIKAGTFRMGSPDSDKDARDDEKPQHEVTISKDFYLSKYPVTQEQYRRLMGSNPSWFSKEGNGKEAVAGTNTDRFPVESVTLTNAEEFCKKLSALTKRRVELPTEAQWEYACRAGTTTRYFCGDVLTPKDANFVGSVGRTTEVGKYPPNRWGLYDMAGNVWQLCADSQRQYTAAKVIDPIGPRAGASGVRGGSRFDDAAHCRSANRTRDALGAADLSVGFRVLVRVEKETDPALEHLTNSIGLKMAKIPKGEFTIGSPNTEENRRPSEGPQHTVQISRSFYLGTYTVTQGQYEKVMGKNPSGYKSGPDFPVEQVSWQDSVEFCKKLSDLPAEKKAGHVYRLPTQAEWEYACRAGTTTPFHYGDSLSSTQANFDGSQPYGNAAKGPRLGKTVKVGSYKPNAWGLYDMHGNVNQWCADGAGGYTDKTVVDPLTEQIDNRRVLRGGSWNSAAWQCRSARQTVDEMTEVSSDRGFRVVMTITPKDK